MSSPVKRKKIKMEKEKKKKFDKYTILGMLIGLLIILLIIFVIFFLKLYINSKKQPLVCNDTDIINGVTQSKDKPIIYLYPEKETEVSVKVGRTENLTTTYPKYEEGWNVIARPDGSLTDIKTGRSLYALYWEGINTVTPNLEEGFCIKGEDTAKFLEEKLKVLGLNEREAEEFIVYWLPRMEKNEYNFIRFQTKEEIEENMPLEITPNPDTTIRIVMEFKPLDKPIEIKEQQLPSTPERKGFTVVEWGGTEIQ